MHQRTSHQHWAAAVQLGAVGALCLGLLTPLFAGPLGSQDSFPLPTTSSHTSEPVLMDYEGLSADEVPLWPAATGAALTAPLPTKTGESTSPPAPAGQVTLRRADVPTAAQNKTRANAEASVHGAIKDSVRPVYDQLVESGALSALHDFKAILGMNKNQWDDETKTNAGVEGPRRWDAPSGQGPTPPQRTAAQVQSDREMAGMMREKLFDQITPWLIGAVVLYAVGYLARLLLRYRRWKSSQRDQRRSARSQRHASRRGRASAIAATPTPSAPPATAESEKMV